VKRCPQAAVPDAEVEEEIRDSDQAEVRAMLEGDLELQDRIVQD